MFRTSPKRTTLPGLEDSKTTQILWMFLFLGMLSIVIVLFLQAAILDFKGWLRLGAGGLPHNFYGWIRQWYIHLRFVDSDTSSLECYDLAQGDASISLEEKKRTYARYLAPLPIRRGSRRRAAHWCIPQRQAGFHQPLPILSDVSIELFPTGKAPPLTDSQLCRTSFTSLATTYHSTTHVSTSLMERHGPTIFLSNIDNIPTVARSNRGEITHFHPSDCSAHVTLSHADCREVIEKGWGERHGLAGKMVPLGYMLLFAPEDEADLEVIMSVMEAGVRFMIG